MDRYFKAKDKATCLANAADDYDIDPLIRPRDDGVNRFDVPLLLIIDELDTLIAT